MKDPALLTIADTAERLGVDGSTLYRWAASDQAPAIFVRIGRRKLAVSALRLERYLHGDSADLGKWTHREDGDAQAP